MAKNESPAVQPVEETFDVAEIAQNAQRLFGYSTDLAKTAFALAGVKRATLAQAKTVIKEFAERKVN